MEQPERAAAVALPALPPLTRAMTPRRQQQDNDEEQDENEKDVRPHIELQAKIKQQLENFEEARLANAV